MTQFAIRPVVRNLTGTTCFFRNRPLLDTLLQLLHDDDKPMYKALVHACSIGAEPYSLSIAHKQSEYSYDMEIYATDICSEFIDLARHGAFPKGVVDTMTMLEAMAFEPASVFDKGDSVVLKNRYMDVTFFPALDYREKLCFDTFDVVLLNNTLVYVSEADQRKALHNIAEYNTGYLVCSAFHADTIAKDLADAGYVPVLTNAEKIYNSWELRQQPSILPENCHTSWHTGAFDMDKAKAYQHCSIFRRVYGEEGEKA